MFKIGDFSKLTNLTVRALHHYENLELLTPEKIDPQTNYRYYSACQLATVNKIKLLQQIGLPLKTIKEILQNNNIDLLNYHYQLRESEIHHELTELKKKQTIIKRLQTKMKEGKTMEKYHVTLKEIPKRKVMSIRKIIDTSDEENQLWKGLYKELLNQNVKMTNPPFGMSLYHDKEYKEKDIDIEIQSNILGTYNDTNEVTFYEAPAFTMASVTFNGSYEQMPEVSQAIALWIEDNNYKIGGAMVNISYVSPFQDPNPDNWVTESGFILSQNSLEKTTNS